MLKRILSRRTLSRQVLSRWFSSESTVIASPRKAAMENLETRVLLHNPTVIRGTADNRGEVQLTLDSSSAEIAASSFNKNSVQMYEAGPDGVLANADDVRVSASVRFTPSNQRLLVRGEVPAGNGYRIKIVSSRITVSPGFGFDGNFTGTFPSGDGVAGGNFEMQVKNIKTSQPTVKMYTTAGTITMRLRADLVAATVNNFIRYANAGRYDGTKFHRNGRTEASPIDIIQGGGYADLNTGTHIATFPAIALQAGAINNDRGTISMARTSEEDSATSEFFFNIQDNAFLNPSGGVGGYAVFGSIIDGQAAADAIFNSSTVVKGPFNNVPQISGGDVDVRRVSVNSRIAAL